MAQYELAKTPRGRWAVYCKDSQTYEYEGHGKRFCQQVVTELNRTEINVIKSVDLTKITNLAARDCIRAIFSDKVFDNNLLDYTWTSGCTTTVYPIMFWANEVKIQLKGEGKKHFAPYKLAVERVVKANPKLFEYGYVDRYDGSCPMSVTFKYTDRLKERLKE